MKGPLRVWPKNQNKKKSVSHEKMSYNIDFMLFLGLYAIGNLEINQFLTRTGFSRHDFFFSEDSNIYC